MPPIIGMDGNVISANAMFAGTRATVNCRTLNSKAKTMTKVKTNGGIMHTNMMTKTKAKAEAVKTPLTKAKTKTKAITKMKTKGGMLTNVKANTNMKTKTPRAFGNSLNAWDRGQSGLN